MPLKNHNDETYQNDNEFVQIEELKTHETLPDSEWQCIAANYDIT